MPTFDEQPQRSTGYPVAATDWNAMIDNDVALKDLIDGINIDYVADLTDLETDLEAQITALQQQIDEIKAGNPYNYVINGDFSITRDPAEMESNLNFLRVNSAAAFFPAARWFASQTGNGVNRESITRWASGGPSGQSYISLDQVNSDPPGSFDGGHSRLATILPGDVGKAVQGGPITIAFKWRNKTPNPTNTIKFDVRYDIDDSTLNTSAVASTPISTLGSTLLATQDLGYSANWKRSVFTINSVPAYTKRIALVFSMLSNSVMNTGFDIADVCLFQGKHAFAFASRPRMLERQLCESFYTRIKTANTSRIIGHAHGTIVHDVFMPLSSPMCKTPAFNLSGSLRLHEAGTGGSSYVFTQADLVANSVYALPNGVAFQISKGSIQGTNWQKTLKLATTDSYIELDAEL
ncbi:MAG: hypothetical protein OHK0046_47970 [Anaerolineae bacterium]